MRVVGQEGREVTDVERAVASILWVERVLMHHFAELTPHQVRELAEQGTRAEQVLARHGLSGANLEGGA